MAKVHHPLPTHNKLHFDPHEIIAIVGPWGSGKSTICAIELAAHCHRYKCDALVVRDTYPALKDSCVKKWSELFAGLGEMNMGPPPTWRWSNELAGHEVMFRSAEHPEDIQKFGSVEAGGAWLEEVTPGLLPGGALNIGMAPEILGHVMGRVRKWDAICCSAARAKEEPHGHRKVWLSALPPPTQRHWFYRLFYERKPFIDTLSEVQMKGIQDILDKVSLYRLTANENLKNLPENYYETQAAFLTSEDQIERFIRGEVGSAYGRAGIYVEQWCDETHINREIEATSGPMILGIDGGLDASAVWMQIQPSGRIYVLDELCTHGLGLEDFGLAVQQHGIQQFGTRTLDIWADPAIFSRSQNDAKDGAWYLGQVGLRPKPAPQDPDVRISAVRTWLSRMGRFGPLLQVHPRCEMIIEGFRGAYHWKVAGGVPLVGRVDKNEYSHPHDALQYPLAAYSGRGQIGAKLPPLPRSPDILGQMQPNRMQRTVARRAAYKKTI